MLVGSDVTLRCSGTIVSWEEYYSDSHGGATTISNEATLYDPDLYNLITEPTGTYDLTIKSIKLEQGGLFRCKALTKATDGSAYVITFSGEIFLIFLP